MVNMAKNGFRDEKAPASVVLIISDGNGLEWGRVYATPKEFSTGSVGYNASSKVQNPANPEARYQIGVNMTLIGSKPF
jgi:hypothetical protein